MPSYPFLSDEWLDEARKIRGEYEGKTLRENLGLPRPENRFFAKRGF